MEEVVGSIPISSTFITFAESVVCGYLPVLAERPERKELRGVYRANA